MIWGRSEAPLALTGVHLVEDRPPVLGILEELGHRERDGTAGLAADRLEQRQLLERLGRLATEPLERADGPRDDRLEHAATVGAQRGREREQLCLGCEGPGHGSTRLRSVPDGPRGGEPDRARPERLLDERGHGRQVVLGRVLVRRAALPHHVEAHRAMGDLGRDVERVVVRVEHVEVLGERLPSPPRHPDAEGGAGDVLHALHEVDERVVVAGSDRGEPNAAVAHHERRDAVRGRGLQRVVPGGLAVVVGVDVHPARRHDGPVGVDDAGRRRRDRADLGDAAVEHADVRGERRSAGPVDDGPALDHDVEHGAPPSRRSHRRGGVRATSLARSVPASNFRAGSVPAGRPGPPKVRRRDVRAHDPGAGPVPAGPRGPRVATRQRGPPSWPSPPRPWTAPRCRRSWSP